MDTDPIILKADNFLFTEISEDQIRDRQDQEYHLTEGMVRLKDMRQNLVNNLKKSREKVEKLSNNLEKLNQSKLPITEFNMIVERYSYYNPNMSKEEILTHPRVLEKKPARDKYLEKIRQAKVSLNFAKDIYSDEFERVNGEFIKLADKFAMYAAVIGSNETLPDID